VSLHAPLTEETKEAVSTKELARLSASGILINTSRGEVVDYSALVSALKANELGGAGIDVFSNEPPKKDCPLFSLNNVIVSPHIAGTTLPAMEKKSLRAAENVRKEYNGNMPESTININDLLDL
jgi:phosphoglycerate dehydrogenase-like enzyme